MFLFSIKVWQAISDKISETFNTERTEPKCRQKWSDLKCDFKQGGAKRRYISGWEDKISLIVGESVSTDIPGNFVFIFTLIKNISLYY